MMSQSCCDFIKNCSKAGIQATDECIGNIFKELNNYFHTTYLSKFIFRFMAIGNRRIACEKFGTNS